MHTESKMVSMDGLAKEPVNLKRGLQDASTSACCKNAMADSMIPIKKNVLATSSSHNVILLFPSTRNNPQALASNMDKIAHSLQTSAPHPL